MDIIQKIDNFFKESEEKSLERFAYVTKENTLLVLDLIIEEVDDDKLLLEMFKGNVNKNWSVGNVKLLKDFYKILEYYGVVGNSTERKTIMETKGNRTIVRKFINLKSKEQILRLI